MYVSGSSYTRFIFNLNTKQFYSQITHNDSFMHRYMYITTMVPYQPTPLLPILASACPFSMIQPLFLLTWRSCFFCSWCEYPSSLVPGLLSTVLPLLLHKRYRSSYISIYIDDINNVSRLVWWHITNQCKLKSMGKKYISSRFSLNQGLSNYSN